MPDRPPVRCLVFDLASLAGDRHQALLDAGHASGDRCLPATRDPDQATVSPAGRQCAASSSTWHHLPAIATMHRPTLAPPSPCGRLHRSRRRRPGRTGGARAPQQATRDPDQTTARPTGCQCAASPSPWHHLPAIATTNRPTLAPSSPCDRLHRSRRRQPGRTGGDRAPQQATRGPDQTAASPIGRRCVVSPSTWHHLPTIATEHCPTLAPSSPRGRLPRSRRRQPGRTADELHALDPSHASLPTIKARLPTPPAASAACQQPEILTRTRHARSAANALPRLRPDATCQ